MTRTIRMLAALFLALGMAWIGGARLGSAALAQATPSPLVNEHFISFGGPGSSISGTCTSSGNGTDTGNFTFSFNGTAQGPYPGTFTESGSFAITNGYVTAFSATFTITSATGTVTGSKSLLVGEPATCNLSGAVSLGSSSTTYTATINGAYQDTGTANVVVAKFGSGSLYFSESFVTSNGVVPILPTSTQQCKAGGWQTYSVFKNQGDCVSFVATGGKNPPDNAP